MPKRIFNFKDLHEGDIIEILGSLPDELYDRKARGIIVYKSDNSIEYYDTQSNMLSCVSNFKDDFFVNNDAKFAITKISKGKSIKEEKKLIREANHFQKKLSKVVPKAKLLNVGQTINLKIMSDMYNRKFPKFQKNLFEKHSIRNSINCYNIFTKEQRMLIKKIIPKTLNVNMGQRSGFRSVVSKREETGQYDEELVFYLSRKTIKEIKEYKEESLKMFPKSNILELYMPLYLFKEYGIRNSINCYNIFTKEQRMVIKKIKPKILNVNVNQQIQEVKEQGKEFFSNKRLIDEVNLFRSDIVWRILCEEYSKSYFDTVNDICNDYERICDALSELKSKMNESNDMMEIMKQDINTMQRIDEKINNKLNKVKAILSPKYRKKYIELKKNLKELINSNSLIRSDILGTTVNEQVKNFNKFAANIERVNNENSKIYREYEKREAILRPAFYDIKTYDIKAIQRNYNNQVKLNKNLNHVKNLSEGLSL